MLNLRQMTEAEFVDWMIVSKADYAAAKMRANSLTQEEANNISEESFKRLLPNGLRTKDSYLYTLEEGGKNLGFFWFSLQGATNNRKAFIYDVKIYEAYQGKGYGRKIMQLGEAKAKETGALGIALHVFGDNDRAINLYKSLNYQITDLVMEKRF